MKNLRVQFIHGLEGSPQGSKARLLAEHFDARTPAMDTADFEDCVRIQAELTESFLPQVLVGSSFGAAVAVALRERGLWQGPTLLLAQAALHYDPNATLPLDIPIWIVHGQQDDLIDPEDSRRLARTGSPDRVRLIEVEDDHPAILLDHDVVGLEVAVGDALRVCAAHSIDNWKRDFEEVIERQARGGEGPREGLTLD